MGVAFQTRVALEDHLSAGRGPGHVQHVIWGLLGSCSGRYSRWLCDLGVFGYSGKSRAWISCFERGVKPQDRPRFRKGEGIIYVSN